MAQFATADDLSVRLGIEQFGTDEFLRAELLLERASGLIQDEAQQAIELVTDTLTLPGTNDDAILLPQRPVVSVDSVTLDGRELAEGTDWYLDHNTIRRLPHTTVFLTGGAIEGLGLTIGAGFGWPTQTLEIAYSHGYPEPPASVKALCIEMVVRVWVNPGGVSRETVGDTSTTYDREGGSPSGMLLTREERRIIRRLFPRPLRSVTLTS